MHLLNNDSAKDRLRRGALAAATVGQQILADANLPAPSMDHLDELEAQSIYILREAFARLKKLALLWSLGKDSNVMIWLGRKGLLRPRAIPAPARRHRQEISGDVRVRRPVRQRVGARSQDRALPADRRRRS